MKWIQVLVYAMLTALLLQACTVEKRRYMGGWHVDWRSRDARYAKAEPEHHFFANPAVAPADSMLVVHSKCADVEVTKDVVKQPEVSAESGSESTVPDTTVKIKDKKPLWRNFNSPVYSGRISELEETHSSTGGRVFGIIGFVLLIISVGLLLTGTIFSLGWTSLGLIISATLLATIAFLFGLLSWIAFKRNDDATPWYVWVTLIIGGMAVLLWLKVLLDRARA
ncbi:MAG: hypothetical protein ACKVOK_05050 [Flavobacteriales bacterium]